MNKHTSGPWGTEADWIGPIDPTGQVPGVINSVCAIHPIDGPECEDRGEETEANTRLIVAAPDLLEACRKALHLVEENNEEIVHMPGAFGLLADLRAALEKATKGE
jgi:hypothetical protein